MSLPNSMLLANSSVSLPAVPLPIAIISVLNFEHSSINFFLASSFYLLE